MVAAAAAATVGWGGGRFHGGCACSRHESTSKHLEWFALAGLGEYFLISWLHFLVLGIEFLVSWY